MKVTIVKTERGFEISRDGILDSIDFPAYPTRRAALKALEKEKEAVLQSRESEWRDKLAYFNACGY